VNHVDFAGIGPVATLDLVLLVGLLLSVVLGAWRGLTAELLALAGWGVAYLCAQAFGPEVGRHLPIEAPGDRLNVMAGLVVAFLLGWVAWALVAWLITRLVRASVLSGADRLLGAGFGFVRGLLVALVLVTLLSMTAIVQWPSWQASHGVAMLQGVLHALRPVLPAQVVKFLPEQA
jgi:membrane protein required for colicin V production